MSIIKHKNKFLAASAILVIASWILVGVLGLQQGIDLQGGTEWSLAIQNSDEAQIQELLTETGVTNPLVRSAGEGKYIIRMPDITEEEHQTYLEALQGTFPDTKELSFASIGPSIGEGLRSGAIRAGIFVILGISIYVAWSFRKTKGKISSWKYGLTTLITLFHDVSFPIGLLALLGWFAGIEIDTNFIVALLVVMGFSVHDTIVVFDRIRENLLDEENKKQELRTIVDKSINETIMRSINTSLTLIFVLVTLLIWGPESLFFFILTILVGTIVGTYSSICIASPIVYYLGKKQRKSE